MDSNPKLADTFHSLRFPESSDVEITEYTQRNPMDVEFRSAKSTQGAYKLEDIKTYLNNLYQTEKMEAKHK